MRHLGQLEAAVMQHLWSAGEPVSVRSMLETLTQERPLAYTTVMTVLDRLVAKDVVARERDGRAFRYAPRRTRAAMTADLMREALEVHYADELAEPFVSAGLCYYRDGRDSVAWHGDLVVMGGSCQCTWEHAIPKTTRAVGPRVSVQFRPRGVR